MSEETITVISLVIARCDRTFYAYNVYELIPLVFIILIIMLEVSLTEIDEPITIKQLTLSRCVELI